MKEKVIQLLIALALVCSMFAAGAARQGTVPFAPDLRVEDGEKGTEEAESSAPDTVEQGTSSAGIPVMDGFDEATNMEIELQEFKVYVPSYYGEAYREAEDDYLFTAEQGRSLVQLKTALLMFGKSGDFEENKEEYFRSLLSHYAEPEIHLAREETIAGLYGYEMIFTGYDFGTMKMFVVAAAYNKTTGNLLTLTLSQTTNAGYDYLDDFERIVDAVTIE